MVARKGSGSGLDLRGGMEVVLKARPTQGEKMTSDTLSQSADIMRRRIDPRGILQPEIRTSPGDQTIDISIPGVKNPNAVERLLVAGQLQSFDFYQALTPVSTQSRNLARPCPSLYDMLKAAPRSRSRRAGPPAGRCSPPSAAQPGEGQRHRLRIEPRPEIRCWRTSTCKAQARRPGLAPGAGGHRRPCQL